MASETANIAAAKKQLAEALAVLQKHGVVSSDDVLLVQSVVGKGVGAPVDIAADAFAGVASAVPAAAAPAATAPAAAAPAVAAPAPSGPVLVASAPVFVPGAPADAAPSAAAIRKAFLEKVHAAAAAATSTKKEKAEEKKEDGKGEAAGELLVDVSVPATPAPTITVPLPSMVVLVPAKGTL
ncbi:hypothetical protein DL770_004165 [Monosporascus sp. CRB-9-2]|nr:hypothetical protein DL770_004165 [Monosporascus sp. CRB-9-2]